MRILIINQPFWPDVVATAQHLADWTEHLVARGHTVTVIASRSVYGRPGAVLPRTDNYKGARVLRVGSNLFHKGGALTRLVDFCLFHLRALWKALTLPRQDVVVCLTTPPFIGVVGMLVQALRGSRYVQYEMDLYPDIAVALGTLKKGGLPELFFEGVHRRLLRAADRVVVLGRCMRRVLLAKRVDDITRKLVVVTPWAEATLNAPSVGDGEGISFRQKNGLVDKFVVMYAGNLGLAHDTQTMLGAMERLRDDDGVRFVFVGGGRRMKEIQEQVAAKGYRHVLLLDYLPREELPDMLAAADVHLITQAPGTAGLIVPSKLYGILAAGRPSIYIGPPDAEIPCTLAEEKVGTVLAPGDVDGFVAALDAYRKLAPYALVARTRAVLERGHTRLQCTQALTAMVESLAAPRGSEFTL
jgi:colanic acid biosynthesis glycosyl transferase WcaI